MIILRADNRILTTNAKFSYLVENYASEVSAFEVTNIEPFAVGKPFLLGEFGKTDAEVLKVYAIDGNEISVGDVTNNNVAITEMAHPESTRVTVLQYDQIRFYWTAAAGNITDENPTFDTGNPLTGWIDLDPASYYTTYADTAHSTGFGWFKYRNATTLDESAVSNPIPYAGFTYNTAQQVFADFESLLNTNELKLVSVNDKFSWLNEALATFKNKLNLTDVEYTVSTTQTLSVTANTAEYLLTDDFSDVVEITNGSYVPVDFIPVSQIMDYQGQNPTTTKYYLRGRYIGFSPTPTESATYYYKYRAKATRVTSLSTYIDLPDNAFYCLKDWMMYRAYSKFGNPQAMTYYQTFKNSVEMFIQSSVKRSANLDAWDISSSANT